MTAAQVRTLKLVKGLYEIYYDRDNKKVSSLGLNLVFLAGAVFSAQALAMMVASPVWGAVADRVGRPPMVLRAMVGGGLFVLLMGFVQNAEQLVVLRIVQGLAEMAHPAGQDAETGHAAVFFRGIHQRLHAHADRQHRLALLAERGLQQLVSL